MFSAAVSGTIMLIDGRDTQSEMEIGVGPRKERN